MTHPTPSQTRAAGPTIGPALEAARERAIRLLTDRYADDTLSVEEFERRLDRLYQAQSPADLDELVRDVLVPAPRGVVSLTAPTLAAPVAPPLPSQAPVAAPGRRSSFFGAGQGAKSRHLACILGDSTVSGPITLTPHVEVDALFAAFVVDLRDAEFPPEGIELQLDAGFAEVRVLVPEGVWVEGAPLSILATFRNEAAERGRFHPGAPRIRLTGTVWFSDVKVRSAPAGPPTKTAWKMGKLG